MVIIDTQRVVEELQIRYAERNKELLLTTTEIYHPGRADNLS